MGSPAAASPGNLLEMQIPGLHLKPIELRDPGGGAQQPVICILTNPSRWFWFSV